jgi:arabinofuranosyltransferase
LSLFETNHTVERYSWYTDIIDLRTKILFFFLPFRVTIKETMQLTPSRLKRIGSKYPSLVLLIVAFIAIISGTRYFLVDDAYISFRYAYQLAHNGMLVYNLGERVEGITNLLWTLLLAVINRLFNISIEQAALLLSLVFLFLACFRLWQLGPMLGATHLTGALAATLLLTSTEFLISATNGLEVSLYTFLLAEIIYSYCSEYLKRAYVFAGLLFMTRPEGLFFGLLIIGLVYYKYRSLRKIGVGLSILGSFVMLVTLYRYFMYGSILPNSIIAKSFPVSLLPGLMLPILRYFIGFVKANAYFVILVIGAVFALSRIRSLSSKPTEILLYCLSGLLFSFIVMARNGGDWMGNHRLLAQYGVLYSVLLIVLVGNNMLSIVFAAAFVTLPFLQTTNVFVNYKPEFFPKYQENSNTYADVSRRLAPVVNKSDVISAEAIGYISYRLTDNPFIDPLGLTNAYFAKHGDPRIPYGKSDFQYLVETLQPSVMIWHYPGHMKWVDSAALTRYEDYCLGSCGDWNGFLVMIRRDRVNDLAPAFSDWQKIDINTDWKR